MGYQQANASVELELTVKPHTFVGSGTVARIGELVRHLDRTAALVVTDPGLADSPVVDAVRETCTAAGVDVHVHAAVRPNPTSDDVAAGIATAGAVMPAALVAVGGGSSLDTAKAITVGLPDPAQAPIIAVPTTAGSGAETNAFGVITDSATRRKGYVGGDAALARFAVLDPELTVGMPSSVTAATGVDALTHAIESYCSIRANPWSDGVALQAVEMIAGNLANAVAAGTDIEARGQLLFAAHLSGIAMANTGLGICHALAHPLGGRYDVPHGAALAVLLPTCLRFNLPVRQERLARLAFALGAGHTDAGEERNAEATVAAVTELVERVGLRRGLADYGIGADAFDVLAEEALADAVLANTPRRPDHAAAVRILRAAA